MTPCQASPDASPRPETCSWSRLDTAQTVAAFADPFDPPRSQRQYAQQHAIPRSTVGYWLRHEFPAHLDPDLVGFFRRPAGRAWLRRLVLALLLIFHHKNACGLRPIGDFLRQVELDPFVGSSYGALYDLDSRLQDELIRFAQEERHRLAADMTHKDISLCLDENFHGPHVCLVGIEPVSDFILVETYRDQRDSVTWAQAIREGNAGLDVTTVAFTSDQASGLIRCAHSEFSVAYHPDLLHLQYDLAKPILLPLARPIHQAEKELAKAQQRSQQLDTLLHEPQSEQQWTTLIEAVLNERDVAEQLEEVKKPKEAAVPSIREVSRVYHPFDRETGAAVTAEQMQARLRQPLDRLEKVIEQANLSERAQEAVQKAREWVVVLVGCIGWFWTMTRQRLDQLELGPEAEQALRQDLIASCYWEMASAKEKAPQERQRLKELAQRLKEKAWAEGGVLARLSPGQQQEAQRVARQCAELFQRSSSCVEGRNGRLSLFHHGQTRLSDKRLQALTAVHNYVVRREDGSSAAERFFGNKQRDAFSCLLQRMPDLPGPAAKRRKPPSDEGSAAD
jgi:Family of unknown function (DUF6399)